ncbi:MAG: hypothetical protein H7647_10055, partial [Candidatus Heimdallarchaeota archaeon]|nr:hypothetical protein [Candidatus Heimdallarchaeota archaeon]MCK4254769.1 hypothetical protein [Candidatus Heimdallarchaeota archaeon]
VLADQAITHNIDSTLYPDEDLYKIDFYVEDSLGQSSTIRRTFGIDNDDIGITFGVNSSIINPGEFLSASWSLTITGAQLVNQTLVLGGNIFPYQQVFTSTDDTVTEYILTGSQTLQMAEDDLVFTLYVKDAAGNLNSAGEVVSLVDNLAPTTHFITPVNESYDLSGIITIEIYASDPTGINTEFLDIYFFDIYSDYYYLYQQSVSGEATYQLSTKSWVLEFNSFVLPNGNYSMEAIVYDTANIANAGYSNSIISVGKGVLEISGVIKGKGSPFVRGYLTFYLENLLPTEINITLVNINWDPDIRIDFIYDMIDNTDGTIWLSSAGSPYSEEANLPVQNSLGAVFSGGSKHKLTIRFDYKNRPDLCSFIISFYIVSSGSWETITIP